MHALGNDFVIIDGRELEPPLNIENYRTISDRRRGVGFDQLLTLLPPRQNGDIFMRIHNSDGSEAEACGNGTRCVASMLMSQYGIKSITIETLSGALNCTLSKANQVTVDMGKVLLNWSDIPLLSKTETLYVRLKDAPFNNCSCVNIGNPHAVFFAPDIESICLEKIGPVLENDIMFPDRANIEFVKIISETKIRMRVWERGVGITPACGSGACAAVVCSVRRGLTNRKTKVLLDGGVLDIEWLENNHILMTGPTEVSFTGTFVL